MNLFNKYLEDNHRYMNKWYHYLPVYEKHLERFRNRHVNFLEVGVGQGGNLQLFKSYLGPFARIIGLDVDPRRKQCEETLIHVRIGNQANHAFLAEVIAEFGPPDIVIDDGSHLQPDVNATFDFLYPKLPKNAVYIVEDLHAAYWPNHGGGLGEAESFIERAKSFVDEMHAVYTRGALQRTALGDRTTSIHFYDSIVVFEVGEHRGKVNQSTGNPGLWRDDWLPEGETRQSFAQVVEKAMIGVQSPGEDVLRPLKIGPK
jgi:hypothetical protein